MIDKKHKIEYEKLLRDAKEKKMSIESALSSVKVIPKVKVNIKIMGLDVTIESDLAVQILEKELLNILKDEFYLMKVLELADEDYNLLY